MKKMKREFKKKIQTDFLLNLFHHVVKRVTSTGGHLNQLTLSYLNIEGRHTCVWGGKSQFKLMRLTGTFSKSNHSISMHSVPINPSFFLLEKNNYYYLNCLLYLI